MTSSLASTRETSPASPRPRAIEGLYRPPPLHWVGDGFRVYGYFSVIPDAMRKLSPFLMLDYHPEYMYPPAERPRGVGVHPHRGFETVTWAWQGSVAHHDSAGGGGVIGPGDAQWMTAASGVLHKEYHEEDYSRRGGAFQMAQLWVNLPKAHKMSAPRYQAIPAGEMGVVTLPDGAGTVTILAGDYDGVRGPAATFTPVGVFDLRLVAGGRAAFHVPTHHNLALLVMKGEATLNGTRARQHDFVLFANEGEELQVVASEEAQFLLLSGEPIPEPVVQYGPFVMNSPQEIQQAFVDFDSGRFGHLED
jgi:redox-sensitive bicupin YhaK (pirin superfamily)